MKKYLTFAFSFVFLTGLLLSCSEKLENETNDLQHRIKKMESTGKYFLYLKNCDLRIPFENDMGKWYKECAYCTLKLTEQYIWGDTLSQFYNYYDPETNTKSALKGQVTFDLKADTTIVVSEGWEFFEGTIVMPSYEEFLSNNREIIDTTRFSPFEHYYYSLKASGFLFDEKEHIDCLERANLDKGRVNSWFLNQLENREK